MRRVAVTGLGAVTPLGNDAPATWEAAVAGRSGIDWIQAFDASEFPVRVAAEARVLLANRLAGLTLKQAVDLASYLEEAHGIKAAAEEVRVEGDPRALGGDGEGEDGAGEVVGVAGEGQHLVGGAVVGEDEVLRAGAVRVHPSWVDPLEPGLISYQAPAR
jgi:3-oxoacyl-[acyl-carrier-protein] synthase II